MPFVTVSYPDERPFRLFWKTEGGGPVIMLIRGLARSHRYFAPLIPELSRHFTVLMFDNRGSGQSDTPRGPYRCERMAHDAKAVLDAAGVEQAWLLGMSMGGMQALDMAHLFPDRVSGLILGSVTARGPGSIPSPLSSQLGLAISAFLPKKSARRLQAKITLSESFLDQADAVMDQWDRFNKKEPFTLHSLLSHVAAIRSHNSVPYLSELRVPTLLLAGRLDRLVPCENSVFLEKKLPQSELHIWEDTAHNMETEQPVRMANLVWDFVQRQRNAPAPQT